MAEEQKAELAPIITQDDLVTANAMMREAQEQLMDMSTRAMNAKGMAQRLQIQLKGMTEQFNAASAEVEKLKETITGLKAELEEFKKADDALPKVAELPDESKRPNGHRAATK